MEKNVNRPHKGMIQDVKPVDQPKESYRYALNATIDRNGILTTEQSNEACWELSSGYIPIGSVYTKNNEVVIFSTNGTNSEIGIVKDCTYTPYINSECLGFSIEHQIESVYRVRRGCETVIYWTDNFNPVRNVNLSRLDKFYSDAYIAYLESPVGEFTGEKWNCDLFGLIPPYEIPCFASAEIVEAGLIESGSYNFAIQLLDAGLNPTPWIITSHPINIYQDDVTEPYNNIKGSSVFESDASGGSIVATNKAIKLTLSNLDLNFTYYRIAVIQATGFQGLVTKTIVSPEIPISQNTFIYNGDISGYTLISNEEIKTGRVDIEYAAHIEQLENRLLLANTKGKQVNFCGFQQYASAIHSRYVVKEIPANDQSILGNPKNPLTPFECMGFMGGEVYAMGIVYIFKDGFESPVYHIPGPSPNQRWNWNTEVCDVVDDTSVIATWNSDIEHLVPESQEVAYNALPSNEKIQRWRVYDTAVAVTSTEGQMAYWQCSVSQYEDLESCTGSTYWGTDICGNELVGTPIRHHRFPSRKLVPHVDNNSTIIQKSSLKLNVYLGEGEVWPVGVPSVDITVDYDYNGVPQTQFTLTIFEADLPIVDELIATEIGDITVFTNIVIGGSITGYPELITETTISNASSVYTDDSTLRLLGIKFSNVTYPNSDIVGHYFVRAKRDSFNRTILDSGIAGREREASLDFDFITFSYFTANNNSTEHHYLFSPRFLYNRDALVPDYLKVETEFDFQSKVLGAENYDGVGGWIKEVDTLVEHRIQNYVGTVSTNGDTNYSKEKLLTADALSYDDNYEASHRFYNLSHSNRVQTIKLGEPLPKNGNDIPYVTLRVERDVHCNLDSIKYYKMHNCMFTGDGRSEIYGGDVYITPFQLSNTLLREYFKSALGAILSAILIIGATIGVVATAGTGAAIVSAGAAALGATISTAALPTIIAVTAIVAGAIGVTATAIRALFQAYDETDLDQMAQDTELDALLSPATSFLAYANENLTGIYVESEINCALRQVESHECGEFYNNDQYINDYFRDRILFFDQEKNKWLGKGVVCPEIYHYNKDYSRMDMEKVYFPLPKTYDCCSDCLESHPSRIHYSEQSFQEELSDNFKTFLPNNYKDVESEHGEITGLVRKHNNLFVLTEEALWNLPQNVQQGVVNEIVTFIGSGDYFSIPPRKILDSDMGSAGTKHKWSIIKTPMGVFFMSEIEKAIYLLGGESALKKVSSDGMHKWFFEYSKSYLAEQFKNITGQKFQNFDNPANPNGTGIHSVYDPDHERVIFTKRDYLLLGEHTENFEIIEVIAGVPQETLTIGQVFYDPNSGNFAVATGTDTFNTIYLDNSTYFENKSFTLSYSLLTGSWVAYHSYIPLFYYNDQNTFYSSNNDNSIWKHNTRGSYKVFYGTSNSHIIEYVSVSNPIVTRLWEDIQLHTEALKYDSTTDEYYDDRFTTFNYITVYNSRQVSGELLMIPKDTQINPELYLNQQVINSNNSILIDRDERNWNINDFRDMRTDYTTSMFTKEWSSIQSEFPIDKVVNQNSININKDWFEQETFRDKYLIIRLRLSNFDDVELSTNFTVETEHPSFR